MLVGQPQLKDMLRSPQLLQFAQRVSSDYHLRPLKADEVKKYIGHRLAAVGSRFQLFSDEACRMIADASLGIPRTINILCDTALVYGFAANLRQIGSDVIAQVIEDKKEFGVLPLPSRSVELQG
jgi:type II secretory pathway predicted ATPase ExeA